MTNILWYHKPVGMTPAEVCGELRSVYPGQRVGFAARLDPMASGLLPIIIDDDKNAMTDTINHWDKTYTFKVIMGYKSDTFDIMGLVEQRPSSIFNHDYLDNLKINKEYIQEYPIYSSKTVYSSSQKKKIPLWQTAALEEIPSELPKRPVRVHSIELLSINKYNLVGLVESFTEDINRTKLSYNFRQKEIIDRWNAIVRLQEENSVTPADTNVDVAYLKATVSSGTYIRSIANNLGGVAYEICRVGCGDVTIESGLHSKYYKGFA